MAKCKRCGKDFDNVIVEGLKVSICMECGNELWKQAQQIAVQNYEAEYGEGAWSEADKYEKEDCVFYEYVLLVDELKN